MAKHNVTTTDEQEKVLAYKLDIFNATSPRTLATVDEYIQFLFEVLVGSFGEVLAFEGKVVTDAYEAADKAVQDQVDALLGVSKK